MKRPTKQKPMEVMKICNICGIDTLKYRIVDNSPICFDCVPEQEETPKIPNESTMLKTLLNYNATNTNNPPQKD